MFKKIIHFVKYNNAVVFIILAVFVLGSGVFAQTEAGQELIGQKQTVVEGVDNTLLLEADLDSFDMDFKIEKIESDEKYYYVTYTYLDLRKSGNVWQYDMLEKIRKVSLKIDDYLGVYLAEELSEQYLARIEELQKQKTKQIKTEQVRVELTEYGGLIGQTLSLVNKVFPDYEQVKKRELPSPSVPALLSLSSVERVENKQIADNLTDIYNDYIIEMDPDEDEVFGSLDNCPEDFNPLQEDEDLDGLGDVCDFVNDEVDTIVEEIVPDVIDEAVIGGEVDLSPSDIIEELVEAPVEEEIVVEDETVLDEDPVVEDEKPVELVEELELEVEIIELN